MGCVHVATSAKPEKPPNLLPVSRVFTGAGGGPWVQGRAGIKNRSPPGGLRSLGGRGGGAIQGRTGVFLEPWVLRWLNR
jgi:hypothetical protein